MAEAHDLPKKPAGSDAAFDYECDPCKFEGTVSEGIRFCNECKEFLCDVCWRAHRKSRASRDHNVVQGAALRQAQSEGPALDFEFCLKHRRKIVEFYCSAHDSVFCTDCRVITHGSCQGVESIASVSATGMASKEVEKLTEQINSMTGRLTTLSDDRKKRIADIKTYKQECLQDISSLRKELNEVLDRLEKELKVKLNSMVAEETKKMQEHISRLETVKVSLDIEKNNLDAAKSVRAEEKVFVAMKKMDLQELKILLNDIEEQQKFIVKIDFKADDLLQKILTNLHSFGSLDTSFTSTPNQTRTSACQTSGQTSAESAGPDIHKNYWNVAKESDIDDTCASCNYHVTDPTMLGCGHVICGECIDQYFGLCPFRH